MYFLSNSSQLIYDTLDLDLQKIIDEVLNISDIDFSLVEGYRSPEKQFEYYKKGRKLKNNKWVITDKKQVITNVDGYIQKSYHNYIPSLAVDIKVYVPNKPELAYDKLHLSMIAGFFRAASKKLNINLTWGGDWNKNGFIVYEQVLKDLPHFQIEKLNG